MFPLPRLALTLLALAAFRAAAATPADLWSRDNLVAWCIVPFDAQKRGPEARAELLQRLGFRYFAYDWRAEHIPTFDAEIRACAARGVTISAWWFPTQLDGNAQKILAALERNKIRPQLWVTGGGAPTKNAAEQQQRIDQELARLRPIVAAAARLGCTVGLYNHGGWFGETDHQIALVRQLRAEGHANVTLIYNFHHGHDHIADFAARWARLAPFVDTVNLNGMVLGGDKAGKKILTLAEGDQELAMMRVIQASGWRGRVGILNHRTDVDAEVGLRANLAGLERLAAQLQSGR
ncbi:MAG: hypothetical protein JNL92_11635 [Opitutaceae bacterium]|nr:hypothetical protein [Opitutaceae bacterium]